MIWRAVLPRTIPAVRSFICFCLLATQIPAQQPQLWKRTVTFPDSGERYSNQYAYAEESTVSEIAFEVEGSPPQTLRHTYDEANRLISQQRILGEDSLPFADFTYDAQGRLASKTYYTPDGLAAYTDSLRYDADGLEVRVDRFADSALVYYKTRQYSSADSGRLLLEFEYQLVGTSLTAAQAITYSYQGGRLSRVETRKIKQGEDVPYREILYAYTGERLTGESAYLINAARRTLEDSTLFHYNSDGYLLRKHRFGPDGSRTRTETFEYDPGIPVQPVSSLTEATLRWNRGVLQVQLPKGSRGSLYFFQPNGALVTHVRLRGSRELIPHGFLRPGVYLVQLRTGQITSTLKIPLY